MINVFLEKYADEFDSVTCDLVSSIGLDRFFNDNRDLFLCDDHLSVLGVFALASISLAIAPVFYDRFMSVFTRLMAPTAKSDGKGE